MGGDVADFNLGSVLPTLRGLHPRAPSGSSVDADAPATETVLFGQFNGWFEPELGLALGMLNMDVRPRFLP
jgi:hypothetical protein